MTGVNSLLFVSAASVTYFSLKLFRVCQPENCIFVCVQPGTVSWIFLDLCQHDCTALYLWQRWGNISFSLFFLDFPFFPKRPIIFDTTLISDSLYDTFHAISDVMFFCQILAAVEVLNAAFGIVRTGVIPTLIQVWYECARVWMSWCELTPAFHNKKYSSTRWLEGILSSSSFLGVWRKCTTSQLCSSFSICGAPLRFLGEYAFALLFMVNSTKDYFQLWFSAQSSAVFFKSYQRFSK